MGNVIVAIKSAGSSGGASGVTRYIAESKRDAQKEGLLDKEARPLFSADEDHLSYLEANELLATATGALAEKEDVIHLIISPEKGEFEKLGETLEERLEAFKEIIREAGEEIEDEVQLVELYWIAGIHLNTEIPHAHMAISRDGWDRNSEKAKHIEHLPRALLPHNITNEENEKTFVPGKIADAVTNGLAKQRDLVLQKSIEKALAPTEELDLKTLEADTHQHTANNEETHTAELISETDPTLLPNEESTQGNNQTIQTPEPGQIVHAAADLDLVDLPSPDLATEQSHESSEPLQSLETHQQARESLDHNQPDNFSALPDNHQEKRADLPGNSTAAEELVKPPNVSTHLWRDRYILGRSMVARGEVERLESDLKSTQEHGDKRRFRVYDATHGHTRQISEFDFHRRADASASSAIRSADTAKPEQRQQLRQDRYDMEVQRHEKGIHDHQVIVAKTIHKIETNLDGAYKQHAELRPLVQQIQANYKENNQPLPVPILRQDEINKLQDQAIAARNPQRVHTFEAIREHLAGERGERTRSDEEIGRVEGQLLCARSEQASRHQRAQQFEHTRHQTRWEIDGQKYSLTDIDRRIGEQENRARLFGTPLKITTLHLRPSSRRDAREQVAELKEIRETVVTMIEGRRQELGAAAKDAGRMTSILSEIHLKEQTNQLARDGQRQEKILTRSEINQLIDHGNALSDPAMLKQAFILEARFEERLAPDKQPSLKDRAARANGRELLTDIALRQATDRLAAFEERKNFVPVAIKDRDGGEQTARLFDFRHPRHPVMWLAQRVTESKDHRHLRRETTKAVDSEQTRLKEDLVKATESHEVTKTFSDDHRQELLAVGQPIPDAAFTPKQIIQLEIYATRQQDPLERLRVETLVHRAELASQSHSKQTPQVHAPELHILPTDPLHHSDPQQAHTPDNHQSPASSSDANSHLPEKDSSIAHLPQAAQQPASTASTQINPTDPALEAPDLDILH